ncbi:hypothetical protein P3X46_005261 [Hevea brasiliensis]|uniref:PIG-P domain-containing protein n=1 Tax=Hevea brasiliensis TaxID=3981 RepID=A0ABQ9MZD6_HEVBR|nr:uncharacterized protein LOC110649608 [Hevea brasiliensis]KAJ9185659.1 hypothetical protein P3X46_005261 [Hevea brasiliensis]
MHQPSPSPSPLEERKGDPRIYFLSAFFFSCIVSGGVFLGLYIFLPPDETQPWYPISGFILVAIPWIFWFLTYIYRCIRPIHTHSEPCKSFPRSTSTVAATNPSSNKSHLNFLMPSPNDVEHSVNEHSNGVGRHVRFGRVIVISEYDDYNHENNSNNDDHDIHDGSEAEHTSSTSPSQEEEKMVDSRESEILLTCSAGLS